MQPIYDRFPSFLDQNSNTIGLYEEGLRAESAKQRRMNIRICKSANMLLLYEEEN